jgi:hypothetical protein
MRKVERLEDFIKCSVVRYKTFFSKGPLLEEGFATRHLLHSVPRCPLKIFHMHPLHQVEKQALKDM